MRRNGKFVENAVVNIVFLFLTGAVLGWVYEVLLHVVTSGSFVNRGILHGPWLPIYGTGCVLIVGLKKLVGNRLPVYFVVSTVACGIIEYITSWLMEVVYHTRWWDYSKFPLNLNGRIFLGGLLGFGAAGCVFAFVLLPFLERRYKKIQGNVKRWIAVLFVIIFVVDVMVSLCFPNMGVGITKNN